MRAFKNSWFERFARKQGITDQILLAEIQRAEQGLIDANLGGGVIKQRIARPGQARSTGFRAIILYLKEERAFFVYGFAKSDMENLSKNEELNFRKMAKYLLNLPIEHLNQLIASEALVEIGND